MDPDTGCGSGADDDGTKLGFTVSATVEARRLEGTGLARLLKTSVRLEAHSSPTEEQGGTLPLRDRSPPDGDDRPVARNAMRPLHPRQKCRVVLREHLSQDWFVDGDELDNANRKAHREFVSYSASSRNDSSAQGKNGGDGGGNTAVQQPFFQLGNPPQYRSTEFVNIEEPAFMSSPIVESTLASRALIHPFIHPFIHFLIH
eukprot:GHVU01209896.1.p1 GENE.GHVU01209896.1~~GHVU01209896.1.p1  ORF type:complete len:202 (+),score=21.98 GHVU01209896.1:284-889(+)